jgi:hypothetical protein
MRSNAPGSERHARTLRAWQLAILRFAVTLDNSDRLAVMAIASEIDRLDPQQQGKPDFNFFRRTSAELCAAILQPGESAAALLRDYIAQIDDDRLKRAFEAAIEEDDQPKAPAVSKAKASAVSKPVERRDGLWKGLSPRSAQRS